MFMLNECGTTGMSLSIASSILDFEMLNWSSVWYVRPSFIRLIASCDSLLTFLLFLPRFDHSKNVTVIVKTTVAETKSQYIMFVETCSFLYKVQTRILMKTKMKEWESVFFVA
mmetsp:Transcript_27784/g.44061  ORF Transcript_27784/g.44061 Transcript_27784/m.44061 type:complete len:113 (+) Transcript_27784:1724-2062(+)